MCNIGAWSNRGFTCKSGNFTFPVLPVLTCSTKVLKTSRKYFVFSSSGLIIWQKGKPKRVYSLCFEYSLYFLETADVSFKIALLSCFDWQLTISQGLFNRWLAFRQACYHPTTLFSCWSFFVFRETNGRGGRVCFAFSACRRINRARSCSPIVQHTQKNVSVQQQNGGNKLELITLQRWKITKWRF